MCGAGVMGADIAQVAAQAGARVIVLDRDEGALNRGRLGLDKGLARRVERGKLDAGTAEAIRGAIDWTLDIGGVAAAGLIIEAIAEDARAKTALLAELEKTAADDAVIATNTSSLSVTALANGLSRPERFLGLHFFNPAPVMKLVEVVRGLETDAWIADACRELMEHWGKVAVTAKDVPGFIVNRVARPYYGEAWRALEEGAADAATIDFLYRDLAGFRMGPFELGDLIGQDINATAARSIFEAYFGNTRFRPSIMQDSLAAAGRLGRKTGRGVYDYSPGVDAGAPAPLFEAERAGDIDPILAGGDIAQLAALFDAGGLRRRPAQDEASAPSAEIGGVTVTLTDGRTARSLAATSGRPAVVLDWMRDHETASAIAFAASHDKAAEVARNLAAALGKKAVRLRDRPGLLVFRTLAQLANCAADAARDRIASCGQIDDAMLFGVNYPVGPLAWAGQYGERRLAGALDAIARLTGDAIYRPSEWLQSMAMNDV